MSQSLQAVRSYKSPRLLERHANILAAAREELAERGFHGITMNGLAERAGVTKKTLYNVFNSKERLLVAAISEIIEAYRDVIDETDAGIPAVVASRRAASGQVLAAPAYADAMTVALMQEDPDHLLTGLLLKDAIDFTKNQLELEVALGGLQPGTDIEDLAEQIVSQGWGQIMLLNRRVISLHDFQRKSLIGLLQILKSVTVGARRQWVSDQLHALNIKSQ